MFDKKVVFLTNFLYLYCNLDHSQMVSFLRVLLMSASFNQEVFGEFVVEFRPAYAATLLKDF